MKNKRIICLALVLMLTLGAAACSSSKEDTSSKASAPAITNEEKTIPEKHDKIRDGSDADSTDTEDVKEDTPLSDIVPESGEKGVYEGIRAAEGKMYADGMYTRPESPSAEYNAVTEKAADDTAPHLEETAPDMPAVEEPDEEYPGDDELIIDDPVVDDPIYSPAPEARLLTAGEWNDNENWGFFTNLVKSGRVEFPSYGIDPRHRFEVNVNKPDGTALANAKVTLCNSRGEAIWNAVTDKNGKAYVFDPSNEYGSYVIAESGGKSQTGIIAELSIDPGIDDDTPSGQEMPLTIREDKIEITLDTDAKAYKDMDIMFILDTTGSMGDEMMFLQKEFSELTKEIGTQNARFSVNFYRDKGDEYVTKCNDFTTDTAALQKALNDEFAEGGGDTPEAVDKILEETMLKSDWRDESVKIAFLIFDAPPHDGTEETIIKAVKAAAEKGIRLIPVVSSNSERDTELFGRAIAITTGGTYVFLTDDSGVGDSHLEPIIGDYKVEKLYDIIIRLVNSYRQ